MPEDIPRFTTQCRRRNRPTPERQTRATLLRQPDREPCRGGTRAARAAVIQCLRPYEPSSFSNRTSRGAQRTKLRAMDLPSAFSAVAARSGLILGPGLQSDQVSPVPWQRVRLR